MNNVAELIELAKQKPGEITYGTAGIGSGPHVNVARFENAAKRQAQHRSTTAAPRRRINDVMGGHTNMMMVSVSLALPPHREGKVKMLSIGSAKRLPQLPDIPDHGGVRQPAGLHRRHLVRAGGHRRDAAPDRDKINADVRADHGRARVQGAVPGTAVRRDDGSARRKSSETIIRAETQTWAKVIREQNLVIGTQ